MGATLHADADQRGYAVPPRGRATLVRRRDLREDRRRLALRLPAVDEQGQVIDVLVSRRRDITAARRFFAAAIDVHSEPDEVITDRASALANVIVELLPDAMHNTDQYANHRIECDHGRLKARLRPMRGLKTDRTANEIIRGHAFMQNIRRGRYELGLEARHVQLRVAAAFNELATAI